MPAVLHEVPHDNNNISNGGGKNSSDCTVMVMVMVVAHFLSKVHAVQVLCLKTNLFVLSPLI